MFLNSNPCRKPSLYLRFWTRKYQIIWRIGVESSTSWHPHSPPLGEISKLKLNPVDDAPSLDIVPWKLSVPVVHLDITNFKKDTTNPEIYKQFYLQLISEYPLSEFFFTDGSETEKGVAAAAVSTQRINEPFTCRLPHHSSIYTTELRAILLALRHVYCSKGKSFLILSLRSIFNLKYDHPVLVQILELDT